MVEESKEYDEEGRVIRENRSQTKRERNAVKDFAEELLRMPSTQFALLPISQPLQDALILGQRLTKNARKRHMNYLTRLLIDEGVEHIQEAHEKINHAYLKGHEKSQRILKQIDRLLANDNDVYAELMGSYQDLDIQYVRQLVREAQKYLAEQEPLPEEDRARAPGKHYRRLQKYLAGLPLYYDADES